MAQLTDTAIRNAKPTGKVYRLREKTGDPDLKGFHLVVTPKGAKTFTLAFTSPENGQRKFLTLGSYPGLKLTEARRKARAARVQIREGIDPAAEIRRRREAHRAVVEVHDAAGTLADVCDLYVRDLNIDGKRAADDVEALFAKEVLPEFGRLKAADVTTDTILDVLAPAVNRKAFRLADLLRVYLRAAFELAGKAHNMTRHRGQIPAFNLAVNPVLAVERDKRGKSRPGTRALSRGEVRTVWDWADTEAVNGPAIQLLIATGQRVEEVLGGRWSEFDRDAALWTIPAARRKQRDHITSDHIVPLNGPALKVLKALPRIEGQDLLFPARDGGVRDYGTLGQAVRRGRKKDQLPEFSPRDLRRTWKQRAGQDAKLGLEIRNRLQGHAFTDIGSLNYDGTDPFHYLDEKVAAMAKYGRWLHKLLTGDDVKVVPLRSAQ